MKKMNFQAVGTGVIKKNNYNLELIRAENQGLKSHSLST